MKKFLAIALVMGSVSAFAQNKNCSFEYVKDGSSVNWVAFKTPKKVGVKGSLSEFKINSKAATTAYGILEGATFEVNSQSVVTGDKARDAKIMTFFFKKMLNKAMITGKVLKVTDKTAEVELSMNGKTQVAVLNSTFDNAKNVLNLKGKIDVLNFDMKSNLETLTKACGALHEGVTWPDVEIELVAAVKKSCK